MLIPINQNHVSEPLDASWLVQKHAVGPALSRSLWQAWPAGGLHAWPAQLIMMRKSTEDSHMNVLRYSPIPANRSTVRRQYARWCEEHGLPVRCDIERCMFHTEPLRWCSKPLVPILDHANGNKLDNDPRNLRYLCPNCDSQLNTRGGKNRGRVAEAKDGTFVLVGPGREHHRFIRCTTGSATASGCAAQVRSR